VEAFMREEIHTSKIQAGKRTYYFDVKKASTGILYLDITESKKISDDEFLRNNIMIFPEDINQFKEEMLKIYYKYFCT
jgi:hypothetical protein